MLVCSDEVRHKMQRHKYEAVHALWFVRNCRCVPAHFICTGLACCLILQVLKWEQSKLLHSCGYCIAIGLHVVAKTYSDIKLCIHNNNS